MKSAYEIAMERLQAESGPTRELSDEEKTRIAEIDNQYDAKIAEINVTYTSKIATANPVDAEALNTEMNAEVARAEEKRLSEKDKIWEQGS